MQLNLMVCMIALLALVVDKWSLFDDSTASYVNTPVDESPQRESAINMSSTDQKMSGRSSPGQTSLQGSAETLPHELHSRDEFEQKMFPTLNKVVLGQMSIPAEP